MGLQVDNAISDVLQDVQGVYGTAGISRSFQLDPLKVAPSPQANIQASIQPKHHEKSMRLKKIERKSEGNQRSSFEIS